MSFAPSPNSRRGGAKTGLLVAGASLLALFGIAEAGFRLAGHDFSGALARHEETPIYFRKPRVPFGTVFHRRAGHQEWTGNCMSTRLRQLRITPDPYAADPPATVRYDAAGLRNPTDLQDWEVAVVGDSFTELGHLPDEALFTSLLADDLGLRVKNLGMANSGPFTELALLEHYGLSPSTRTVVVMVFGGNDRQDARAEGRYLARLEETGERFRMPGPRAQTSLLRALWSLARAPRKVGSNVEETDAHDAPSSSSGDGMRDFVHAWFDGAEERIPISFHHAPPGDLDPALKAEIDAALGRAYDAFQAFLQDKDLETWFVFVPCKLRVYQDLVTFAERDDVERFRSWEPFDLAGQMRELAESRGFRFHDLTPAMQRAARDERLFLYNTIYDTHLNAVGSRLVAEELAKLLR